MAKKWAEVQALPEYQALPPDKQEAARQQYFNEVITPQVAPDQVETARSQFDADTKVAPAEQMSMWDAAKHAGNDFLNAGKSVGKFISGGVGSLAGDVAGLSALAAKLALSPSSTARALAPKGEEMFDPTSGIDPAAVRDAVGEAIATKGAPDTFEDKVVSAPGKFLSDAGEEGVAVTGTENTPLAQHVIRTVPMALAATLGTRAPTKAPLKAPPGVAAEVAAEAARPRARSTVNPEGAVVDSVAVPPAQPALAGPKSNLPVAQSTAVGAPSPGGTTVGAPNSASVPSTVSPAKAAGPREPLKDARAAAEAEMADLADEGDYVPRADMRNATPEAMKAADAKTLLDSGVRLTTEQRGAGQWNKQAGSLGRAADTVLGESKLKLEQLQDFTQAVLKKVGVNVRNATPEAMAAVKRKSEQRYEAAHNNVHVKMDGEFIADMNEIRAEANRNPSVEARFDKMLDHVMRNGNTGTMTAEAATKIRAELGRIEGSGDSNLSSIARDVKNALDEAAKRSATPAQAEAMTAARKQFHFMKQIEGAIDPKGFISPKKLWNAINSKRNRNEAVYGKGNQELAELARAGRNILPDAVGNSGSPVRLADVAKVGMVFTDPVLAAKTVGGVFGGRLVNEARATRGTPAALAKRAEGSNPSIAAVRVALSKESPEQKKRRLAAEALRE